MHLAREHAYSTRVHCPVVYRMRIYSVVYYIYRICSTDTCATSSVTLSVLLVFSYELNESIYMECVLRIQT